jgi:murein DD-endopeptidase MepM/ murein hydrolase activator NlpD
MDTDLNASPQYRQKPGHSRPSASSPWLPGAIGACVAVLLGTTGFGLGALYGQATEAQVIAATSLPTAVHVTRTDALPVHAPTAVVTEAMGGPEEPAPVTHSLALQRPRTPGRDLSRTVGRALAMGRPVAGGWVSSRYGQRLDPFTGQPAIHRGLDFAGLDNSAILAAAPGIVTWSGPLRGYGNLIEIDHGGGWVTRYGHNASNLVREGDYVKPGQTIALMGATGRATGTHLHFEVLFRGRHQNPARLVPRDA